MVSFQIQNTIHKISKYIWQNFTYGPARLAYVGGWHGYDNLGDNALFAAIKQIFHRCNLIEYQGGITLNVLSRILRSTKTGVLGGGTLINRNDRWLKIAQDFMDHHKDLFIFGTGVAHPAFWSDNPKWNNSLQKWKPILEGCKYVGVRGPMSAQLLSDAGIRNVDVIGDPVLIFAKDIPRKNDLISDDSIGLNISNDGHGQWGSIEKFHKEYIQLARIARSAGWHVKWFVLQPNDLSLTRQIAELSGTGSEIDEIYEDHNLFMNSVNTLKTFLGTKLHSVVLATCAYVPSIMIEYRPKCRDYMRSIGQDALTVRTDEFVAGRVWEMLNSLNKNSHAVSRNLYASILPLREKQKRKAEELMNDMVTQWNH